jgi:nucleotide-binding universal stress UspA family protein
MTQERLVVGVDGSDASQAALQWAVHVADCYDAPLDVVRAWEPDVVSTLTGSPNPAEMPERVLAAVESQIQQALGQRPSRTPAARAHAPQADPATALLDAGARGTLLVLGRHGEGSVRRLFGAQLGSVASRCLDHATFPVAVVPSDTVVAAPARVLVGVDGSMASAGALRWAVRHAGAVGAPVVAVMAWQLMTVPPPESTRESWAAPPLREWEAQARSLLDETVGAALGGEQVPRLDRELVHRPAAAGLLDSAEPDDLLVLGDRGRGGFSRLLLGSVSRQCAEHARCPVVVVPHRDRSSPPAAEEAPTP